MKKTSKALASTAALCLVLSTSSVFAAENTAVAPERLSGANRVDTAVKIAEKSFNEAWKGQGNAILSAAADANLVDSLAVAPLSYQLKAPILLNDAKDSINADTLKALKANNVKTVYIATGEGVISNKAKAQLEKEGFKVERLGGKNRYETAKNILDTFKKNGGDTKNVALVSGNGLADALSVAPEAARKGMPILLTDGKDAVAANLAEVAKAADTVYAIGGNGIISDALVQQLKADRVSGHSRYETNAAVIKKFAGDKEFSKIYLGNGQDGHLVDSLTGSVLAAQSGSPIVLADKNLADATKDALKGKVSDQTGVVALGGEAVVSDNLVKEVTNIANESPEYVAADKAVKAYEDAKITTAEEITAAKALKAPAVKAVEAVKDQAQKDALNARIAAKDKAIEEAEAKLKLNVESVSAINAKEIQVKFNKPIDKNTVIDDKLTTNKLDDKLKADTIYIDGTAVTWAASLSEDGRILTMQPDGIVTSGTNHKVEINKEDSANFVKDLKGEKADAYLGTVQIVDKTRATLDKFEKINPDIVRVYFSEPVQNPAGDLTATYADGTSAAITAKPAATDAMAVNYVDLDISAAKPGEEATVTFKGIKDYANNVSTPISVKVKKDVDEVKPVIQSVKATSVSSFEIKASEAIKTVDVTKIKVNGTALADGTSTGEGKAVVDTKDNTKIVVTLGDAQSGSVPVEIGADALEDFASTPNKNDVYKTILSFNADKTAPQVTSTKVINKDNNNYLVVNFDEEIKLAPSDLTFKYVDKMGVTQEKTVPAANVNVDGTTKKAIEIKLVDNATPAAALPSNVEYTVEIPGGYVKDNFGNSFVKKNIVFTLGTVSNKLELVSGTPIVEKAGKPGVIEVKFAKAVNIDSATNVANYIVEDAQVEKVKLVENDESTGAKVEVYLKDNTVELSGNYNVTVKGVKGYKENVTEMDSVTKNILLNENVRPTVKEVSIDKFDSATSSTTLTITFTEAVKNADGDANDYSIFIDGKELTGDHVKFETETTGSKAIVVTIDKDLSADITSGKSIKLVAKDTLDITDTNGNTVNADTITIK